MYDFINRLKIKPSLQFSCTSAIIVIFNATEGLVNPFPDFSLLQYMQKGMWHIDDVVGGRLFI
jgi:hypothetical protein